MKKLFAVLLAAAMLLGPWQCGFGRKNRSNHVVLLGNRKASGNPECYAGNL